jgi:magnesium transporter
MNPDFISVRSDATVATALDRVRRSDLGEQQLSIVCVVGDGGRLVGAVTLAELLRADDQQPVGSIVDADAPAPTVAVETDLPEVARVMTDFNLVGMPVLDADGKPVGMIAVDDVLELLLPEEWRWRAGAGRS